MGKFHETEFYRAFKNGGLFFLDEMDASIPEVLVMLNAAIANRYFDFPNGKIDAHPDFRIMRLVTLSVMVLVIKYVGRNQLDGASLNRFAILEIGYSPKLLKTVLQKISSLSVSLEVLEVHVRKLVTTTS